MRKTIMALAGVLVALNLSGCVQKAVIEMDEHGNIQEYAEITFTSDDYRDNPRVLPTCEDIYEDEKISIGLIFKHPVEVQEVEAAEGERVCRFLSPEFSEAVNREMREVGAATMSDGTFTLHLTEDDMINIGGFIKNMRVYFAQHDGRDAWFVVRMPAEIRESTIGDYEMIKYGKGEARLPSSVIFGELHVVAADSAVNLVTVGLSVGIFLVLVVIGVEVLLIARRKQR